MDQLSTRFLKAFNEIESRLRRACDLPENVGFQDVVDRASATVNGVRRLTGELRRYGRLRNAIVHNYCDEETIAVPHERVVKRIETIRDFLRSPPTVGALFKNPVAICSPDTPVIEATKKMLKDKFSQLPVYRGDRFQALLTTNTVARWLAECFDRDNGVVDDVRVEVVLESAEEHDNYHLLKPTHTVADAIEQFTSAERAGRRLDAILITQDGTPNHRSVGIITPADIPKLYEAMP